MEIKISTLGMIIDSFYKQDYFDSDSLKSAIEKMKKDTDTNFGLSFQISNLDLQEQIIFNELLEKVTADS